jgi:hypothetical protein
VFHFSSKEESLFALEEDQFRHSYVLIFSKIVCEIVYLILDSLIFSH